MALRFRRSKSLFPGARLNITKKGASVRLGPKGMGLTVGSSGKRVSAGLPGTGLHYTEKLGGKKQEQSTVPPGRSVLSTIVAATIIVIFLIAIFAR